MPLFKLQSLPRKEIVAGYTARAIHTEKNSYIYWLVEAGAVMPKHNHMHEQVAHVLKGSFELTVEAETFLLEPGQVVVIPPFAWHSGNAITECELLDVFSPVREEYKF